MMKFSRAISRVKWLSGEKTNPEDEDRDGLQNVGFFTAQPFDLADSPREHHIYCQLHFKEFTGCITRPSGLHLFHNKCEW
jgi:hypothetical protein